MHLGLPKRDKVPLFHVYSTGPLSLPLPFNSLTNPLHFLQSIQVQCVFAEKTELASAELKLKQM
jgi:hypothetical protein